METDSEDMTIMPTEAQMFLLEVEERCKKAGIVTQPVRIENVIRSLSIFLKCGREDLRLNLRGSTLVEMLLEKPFEKFRGISDYEAIWSAELGVIEAKLHIMFDDFIATPYTEIFQTEVIPELGSHPRVVVTPSDGQFQSIRISLGPATTMFTILDALMEDFHSSRRMNISASLKENKQMISDFTLVIEGLQIRTHDQAQSILEKIANSVLFQLDYFDLSPIYLVNRKERKGKRRLPTKEEKITLFFPKYQYDVQPMSLYWYGNSAVEMPLLQYLSYYQAIEFYFPLYSSKQTFNLIKRILKDPSFQDKIDENINRLIRIIRPYIGKGGYSDERAALTATIENGLSIEELKTFFEENEKRKTFFTDKREWSKIASQQIFVEHLRVEQDKLVSNVALRIYEIRCKIVHTKLSDGDTQDTSLLPFSKEAQRLLFDIELIKFVARKVLIASAERLTL